MNCNICATCAGAQVQEKRLEAARQEEKMLEVQRQFEEERGPGSDKAAVNAAAKNMGEINKDQHVRNFFNFSAAEKVWKEFKGTYTYYDTEEKKVQ